MNDRQKIILGASVAAIVLVIFFSLTQVQPGERAVVVRLGSLQETSLGEGTHWKIPLITKIVPINVQTQVVEAQADAAAKDLNDAKTKVAVNFHVDPSHVVDVYRNIGLDFGPVVIAPAIQESVKATTANFTAEELVTKRAEVKAAIVAMLSVRLQKSNIILDDVSITDFAFSQSFNDSIEAKVKAEQDALASKNKLEQVKYEAQQQIETAKADAEAIKIKASAVNAQGGADYVKLKWIEKWDGAMPQYQMGNATPLINIPSGQ